MFKNMDYNSGRWKRLREKILRRDGYECQVAKRYGKHRPANTVHHVFPASKFPEYMWSEWNLISVSAAAHNALHIRDTDELTDAGEDLLRRIARKNGIDLPPSFL